MWRKKERGLLPFFWYGLGEDVEIKRTPKLTEITVWTEVLGRGRITVSRSPGIRVWRPFCYIIRVEPSPQMYTKSIHTGDPFPNRIPVSWPFRMDEESSRPTFRRSHLPTSSSSLVSVMCKVPYITSGVPRSSILQFFLFGWHFRIPVLRETIHLPLSIPIGSVWSVLIENN